MSNDNPKKITRRTIIKSTAPAFLATSLLATGASASGKASDSSGEITLEDGELVYRGSERKVSRSEVRESDADVSASDLDGYMETGVEAVNDAMSDGYVKVEKDEEDLWVYPTQRGIAAYGDSDVGVMCGVNSYTTGTTLRGPYHAILMDDGLSRDVSALMASGAAAGTIAAAISAKVGGIPVSILSAIAAALSGLGAALISDNNEGCGVEIRHYPHLGVVPGIGLVFRPQ